MFHYVYILQSTAHPDRFYTGSTENLQARLRAHNEGCCDYTRPYRPWRIKTAIAFSDQQRARDFEAYLTACLNADTVEIRLGYGRFR